MPAYADDDTSLTLMMRVQKCPNDLRAWDEFVQRYRPMMRAWCSTWGLQDSDADDIVQDVLLKILAAMRKLQYDPSRSFRAWLKTVTQHALADFVTTRRKYPRQIAASIELIADSDDARSDLERRLEEAYDGELLELAIHRVKKRVKPVTFQAFQLTAIQGSTGADAAQKLQIRVAQVFVAKHRVQKMLQDEIRILRKERDSGASQSSASKAEER